MSGPAHRRDMPRRTNHSTGADSAIATTAAKNSSRIAITIFCRNHKATTAAAAASTKPSQEANRPDASAGSFRLRARMLRLLAPSRASG